MTTPGLNRANVERFSGFAETFDRYRPQPPVVLVDLLASWRRSSGRTSWSTWAVAPWSQGGIAALLKHGQSEAEIGIV